MGDLERKTDGRRFFNPEFKRQAVERMRSGETTVAALSRELSVVPASRVCELERQIKELQRIIGKQAITIEILNAAREVARRSPHVFKGSKR